MVMLESSLQHMSVEMCSLTIKLKGGAEVVPSHERERPVKLVSSGMYVADGVCGQKDTKIVRAMRTIMVRAVCIIATQISHVWAMDYARILDAIVIPVMLVIDANIAVIPLEIAAATENVINLVSASAMHVTAVTNVSTCVRVMGCAWREYAAVITVTLVGFAKPNVMEMESVSMVVASVTRIGEGHIVNAQDARESPTALETDCVTALFRNATAIRDGKV